MTRIPLLDIAPVTLETAEDSTKAILSDTKERLGFIPNMYGYLGKFPPILNGYVTAYNDFRELAGFTPAEQETVFLTVSRINDCHYCVAAHSMLADKMSGVPGDSLAALRKGRPLPDVKLQAVAKFTESMVTTRGNPGKAAVDEFLAAGFEEKHVFGIILAIACKTFSNFVNHLSATPVDEMFASYAVE